MSTIYGNIIRIIDTTTVIISLGSNDGITIGSVFSIMGRPETIADPITKEVLGEVTIVKARVKAKEVADRFTIASTKGTEVVTKPYGTYGNLFGNMLRSDMFETKDFDEGDLFVDESQMQPWKAKTESPVSVGDPVKVSVPDEADTSDADQSNEQDESNESQ